MIETFCNNNPGPIDNMNDALIDEYPSSFGDVPAAELRIDAENNCVSCSGTWTVFSINQVLKTLETLTFPHAKPLTIDTGSIKKMDTAGAWGLIKLQNRLQSLQIDVVFANLNPKYELLIKIIKDKSQAALMPAKIFRKGIFYRFGETAIDRANEAMSLLSFIGELAMTVAGNLKTTAWLQWRLLLNTIERTGFGALPIVALLSILIGVVLAYQLGIQLRNYGANAYIVDLLGVSILREFGPLITAIIVAGRSGSSFTAEIGTMKVNEEIDALYTLGLAPSELLVLPKIVGLVIAVPLLTLWSDVFGVLGGMWMSHSMLNINFSDFLQRFQQNIELRHLLIGIGKAPVFALLIAVVGCFQGFRVSGGADSVGVHTTKSVVLSIFMIIVADAIFSVIFSWEGI